MGKWSVLFSLLVVLVVVESETPKKNITCHSRRGGVNGDKYRYARAELTPLASNWDKGDFAKCCDNIEAWQVPPPNGQPYCNINPNAATCKFVFGEDRKIKCGYYTCSENTPSGDAKCAGYAPFTQCMQRYSRNKKIFICALPSQKRA